MADDVTDRFNGLDIEGFYAGGFTYEAREKLVLRLSDAMRVYKTTQDKLSSFYELQFNRLLAGRIEAEGPGGLGKVTAWRAHDESALLAETLRAREHLTYGEVFAHFELTCDQGSLDVIARDYFLTIVEKGNLVRGDGGATSSTKPEAG